MLAGRVLQCVTDASKRPVAAHAPFRQHSRLVARASSSSSPEEQQQQPPKVVTPEDDPAEALRCCINLFRRGDLDALLPYVSDDVISSVLSCSQAAGPHATIGGQLSEPCASSASHLPSLDTYARRNLVFGAPAHVSPLSAVRAGPQRYLQRVSVVSCDGEECVLMFTLELQAFQRCQKRGPQLVTHKWVLQSVTGEFLGDELPAHPSPSFSPEAVVQAQLQALRDGKVASVFAHASPKNKAVTGPVERFASMLAAPPHAPLLHHEAAETLQRLQPSHDSYMELVAVTPATAAPGTGAGGGAAPPAKLLYMWSAARQADSSAWRGCWMVDAVQLVGAVPLPPPARR